MRDSVVDWRKLFARQIDKINEQYVANDNSTSEELADMLSTIIEGGIVVSRALNDPAILANQLLEYRTYIKLLYS